MRRLIASIVPIVLVGSCTPGGGGTIAPPETQVEILRPIQLADDARVPENDGHLVDVEVYPDRLVFVYSAAPSIELEPHQVVAGTRHGGYLRRLVTVTELEPTRIEATTVPAELGELILDGHFVVHLRPRTNSFQVAGDDVGAASGALDEGWSILTPDVRNIHCGAGGSGTVTVSPTMDVDFDADIDIDLRTEWHGIIPRGELHSARFELFGDIEAGVDVATTDSTSVSCSWNIAQFFEERGAHVPKREWVTTFAVGIVPVVITHTIEPELTLQVGGSVQTGASTTSARGTIGVRAGARYTQEAGWQPIWEPSRSGNVSLTAGERGSLSLTATASGGIGYQAKLYDTAGPGIGLGPEISGTFTVEPDRCEWEAELSAGVNLELKASLDIPVFDYTLAEYMASQSLAEAVIAHGMGTFPWCEDGGMTELDGGVPPPPMDGGMPDGGGTTDGGGDDAGTDPCESAGDTCQPCNEVAGCGFCTSSGRCMKDSRMGECPAADWQDSPSECAPCTGYGSCADCLGDAFCGWCVSSGSCLTANSGGGASEPCADWLYTTPDMCR